MKDVLIDDPGLAGEIEMPDGAIGLVLLVDASGSGRRSARNQSAVRVLRSYRLGTLLLDLLTRAEALDRDNVTDIDLLGGRVIKTLDWLEAQPELAALPTGLLGTGTGAAAALQAAAQKPARISAIVTRDGRPDLADRHLAKVRAPTLMIVGSEDNEVFSLNHVAMRVLPCHKKLEVVAGATHLFEEPGALDIAASLAGHWFEGHFLASNHAVDQAFSHTR